MTVRASVDSNGVIRAVDATGHAGTEPAGANLACAAATVLLRTAFDTASSYGGVHARAKAAKPGSMSYSLGSYPDSEAGALRGITDFLLTGLSGLEREFPGAVEVTMERERRI